MPFLLLAITALVMVGNEEVHVNIMKSHYYVNMSLFVTFCHDMSLPNFMRLKLCDHENNRDQALLPPPPSP